MKIKQIPLSILLSATACVAPAQSSVTVYGFVDAAVTSAHQGQGTTTRAGSVGVPKPATSLLRLDSGVGPGSRIGFRGVEDLGDGLSARFLLEMGINADTGTLGQGGLAFGREAWVGLASASGWELRAGRLYTPMNNAVAASDPFGGVYWGSVYTNIGLGVYESIPAAPGGGAYQASARADNALAAYYSWGPVSASLLLSAGNENTSHTGRAVNPAISYANGPVRIDASYMRIRQPAEQILPNASPDSRDSWMVGGSYNFGVAKMFAGYYTLDGIKDRATLSPAFLSNVSAFEWSKMKAAWVGVNVPLGNNTIKAALMRDTFQFSSGPEGKGTVLGLVFEHHLSKRTAVYANFGRRINDGNSKAGLNAAVASIASNGYGASHSAFSLGLRHAF